MVFNSDIFLFAFLPVLFLLFWLSNTKEQRYVLLTISGYIFYGYWNWRYCGLLLFSSLVSFFTALQVDGTNDQRIRQRWVTVSIVVDLSLLGFFKYFDFFLSTAKKLVPGVPGHLLHLVLPVGISFYTFHTISYILDVYRGKVKATRNLFEYLTYVSLFSQLVAGPIVRFRQIEDDLEHIDGIPPPEWFANGLGFFVVGLIKKVVIADRIAYIVDPMLGSYQNLSTSAAWVAALAYTFQLYFDFSGYSDMAVGLGYLFKLRIPQNFNAPYRALGITDFWRRWHISLSSWLRDYLYVPLGGNRKGTLRTYVNLMLTMLLGGLWHGANWTFVIWGGYHGSLLILDRLTERWARHIPALILRWLTFLLVVIGWVFFRSTSLHMALVWLGRMAGASGGTQDASMRLGLWTLFCFGAVNTLPETWDIRFGVRLRWAVAYAVCFIFAYFCMNGNQTTFLYYQF
jgi:alginate O-acetyltransferase complex protein AlgI